MLFFGFWNFDGYFYQSKYTLLRGVNFFKCLDCIVLYSCFLLLKFGGIFVLNLFYELVLDLEYPLFGVVSFLSLMILNLIVNYSNY